MKRFSGVVRFSHKLMCWEAGRVKRRWYCDGVRLDGRRVVPDGVERRDVVRAWDNLSAADDSVETLMDVLTVLLGSVPGGCVRAGRVAGFPCDVREWLCDEVGVRVVLNRLWRHFPAALGMMELGAEERAGLVERGFDFEFKGFGVEGIYASCVLPWLGEVTDFVRVCELWEMLGGGAEAGMVLAFSDVSGVADWLEMFVVVGREERERILRIWLSSGAHTRVGGGDYGALLVKLLEVEKRRECERMVDFIFRQLAGGTGYGRVMCLLDLYRNLGVRPNTYRAVGGGCEDFELLRRLAVFCGDSWVADRIFRSDLIDDEVRAMELVMFVHGVRGKRARSFVRLCCDLVVSLRGDVLCSFEWLLEAWAEVFVRCPEGRVEKLCQLSYYVFPVSGSVEKRDALGALCERLLGMSVMSEVDEVVELIKDRDDVFEYCGLPDRVWSRMDRAVRSRNSADRFVCGMRRLLEVDGGFVLAGLRCAGGVVTKMLQEVGELESSEWEEARAWIEFHPLLDVRGAERLELVAGYAGEHVGVEMPVRLLDARRSGAMLRREVLESEESVLDRAQFQVMYLEFGLWVKGVRAVGELGELDAHTVRMGVGLDMNKRVYKKVLRKAAERGEYVASLHPENVAWMKSQRRFWRPGVWLIGVREELVLEDLGRVCFESEHHFEEVLKMGSLVNSCLSVGGCNQHSAIANALDVNKQVIFVRDEAGRFLARQLMAMTEAGELACFEVYHRGGDAEGRKLLEDEFARINVEFAERLGVKLSGNDDYDVKAVVCQDWYDDGLWERHCVEV